MARLKLQSVYGGEYEVTIKTSTYASNGNLYVGLVCWEDGYPEPYSDITVNLGARCGSNKGFVDTNNNPGIEDWIEVNKLGKPTGRIAPSGFCVYPEYEFNMEELKKYMEGN
jgi:hypothetical protein